ncbi:MAG: hypothetical protein IT210_25645 [Armatimonadetes bacterium]|nr:hypothetical protein [Armatimonadota bacterium]
MNDLFDRMQLALLRLENQKRFQIMIDYIKTSVGKGKEYSNSVARAVLSPRGCYYELVNLPEEFSGVVGEKVAHEAVPEKEAMRVLFDIAHLTRQVTIDNTRELSLYAIYDRDTSSTGQAGTFVFHFSQVPERMDMTPRMIGMFDSARSPLFFKMKMDTRLPQSLLDAQRGVLFGLRYKPNRFLLVRIPYEGPDVYDLTNAPGNTIPS